MNKTILSLLLTGAVCLSFAGKAVADDSMSELEHQAKLLLLNKLKEALPPYIEATDKTLAEILEQNPKDSTRLEKFYEIFKKHSVIVEQSGVFGDSSFAEGRVEEDVAWLKGSANDLKTLQTLVDQSLAGSDVDSELNKLFNQISYRPSSNQHGLEVFATILPASRFYCNVVVTVTQEPGQQIETYVDETCD